MASAPGPSAGMPATGAPADRILGGLDRLGVGATLLCPIFLVHGRGVAEAMIAVAALSFLARSARARDWAWLRTAWVRIALAWWVWMVVCSIPPIGQGGAESLVQALVAIRLPLFVAALEQWTLRDAAVRRWLGRIVAAATAYIAAQAAVQVATGHNLFGAPRGPDGELTGPFDKPRAAAPFSRMIFPVLLPAAGWLMRRRGPDGSDAGRSWGGTAAAAALILAAVAIVVLFGQRMPAVLTGFGLLVAALLLPRLRALVLGAVVAGVALVGATVVVSPPAYHRLVEKFSTQLEHFSATPYGWILDRALNIARQHLLTGRGWDGFRTGCALPRYFSPGDYGALICVQHPHSHYLQALVDAGIPGLLLFSALVAAWLLRLGLSAWRGRGTPGDGLRAGLFIAALVQEWPLASSSAFTNMPLGGWFFLLLGWGLAEARALEARGGRVRGAVVAGPAAPYMAGDRGTDSR